MSCNLLEIEFPFQGVHKHSGRDKRALKKSFTITALDYVLYFIFWSSMDRLKNVKTKIT